MENHDERLIAAAQDGDAATLKALLAEGANVNARGEAGMTALMHAARNNSVDCVKILLDAGAEVNTANEFRRTALRMAQEKNFTEAIRLLESAGATNDKPAAASQTDGASRLTSVAKELGFEDRVESAAKWFFWIAGLSLINSLVLLAGGNFNFIVGLSATQFVDAIAAGVAAEGESGVGIAVKIIAFIIDLCLAGVFIAFGVFAKKKQKWSFITGMFLYAGDGLIFLLVKDLLGLGFHLFVLWQLYRGLSALNEFGEAKPANI